MRLLDCTQSLEGGDLVITDVPQGNRACPCEFPAHYGGAGTTLPETAAELGAIQSEIVPQHIKQRRIGRGVHQMRFTVHRNSIWHPSPSVMNVTDLTHVSLAGRTRVSWIRPAVVSYGASRSDVLDKITIAGRCGV